MPVLSNTLLSKYRTVLNVLKELQQSAPQDRIRILAITLEKNRALSRNSGHARR
jgi:hypothetical protein